MSPNTTFVGDLVQIFDALGDQIYATPAFALTTSPFLIRAADFDSAPDCPTASVSPKYCTAEVISLFAVAQDARSTAVEGGAVLVQFQTQ